MAVPQLYQTIFFLQFHEDAESRAYASEAMHSTFHDINSLLEIAVKGGAAIKTVKLNIPMPLTAPTGEGFVKELFEKLISNCTRCQILDLSYVNWVNDAVLTELAGILNTKPNQIKNVEVRHNREITSVGLSALESVSSLQYIDACESLRVRNYRSRKVSVGNWTDYYNPAEQPSRAPIQRPRLAGNK